jgi:hypothetical protein
LYALLLLSSGKKLMALLKRPSTSTHKTSSDTAEVPSVTTQEAPPKRVTKRSQKSPPLTEAERQNLLFAGTTYPGFTVCIRLDRVSDEMMAIYENPKTKARAYFRVDEVARQVVFYANVDDGTPEEEPPQPTPKKIVDIHDPEVVERMHPMAKAFISMTSAEQRSWWQSLRVVNIAPVSARSEAGNIIGFQTTDAGPLGAIVADKYDRRSIYIVSFKTGAPFRLGSVRQKPGP